METAYIRRMLMIVRAEDQERANLDALRFDAAGGAQTFRVGLSPTGEAPATHYICCTSMRQATYDGARALLAGYAGATFADWDMDASPAGDEALLTSLGLRVIQEGLL